MADSNEPKNETVRIDLPPPTAGNTSDPNIKETVRIQLPLREPLGKASTEPRPANPPSFSTPLSASAMPAPDSSVSGRKKETTPIPSVRDQPAGQTKNNQSGISMANVGSPAPFSGIAPAEKNSMLLIWILFGVSLLILIIQIWTYFS
jgi:hypothetical protein